MTNNWRVMHGRTAFTGSRRLSGAFFCAGHLRLLATHIFAAVMCRVLPVDGPLRQQDTNAPALAGTALRAPLPEFVDSNGLIKSHYCQNKMKPENKWMDAEAAEGEEGPPQRRVFKKEAAEAVALHMQLQRVVSRSLSPPHPFLGGSSFVTVSPSRHQSFLCAPHTSKRGGNKQWRASGMLRH